MLSKNNKITKNNYYLSSFFWSTLSKVLNAILGFVSIPLLLGFYGKADYGILSIATACNGYMHLLDLGMNTGAIRYFSLWKAEKKFDLIQKVAHTNITFYMIIAGVNAIGLLALAFWGESLFSITHAQFLQLRSCLFILALFSIICWVSTAFNQLLVSDKQMTFTMQMQCLQTLLKTALVFVVLWADLSLTTYFFFLTLLIALLIIPYACKCLKDKLIDSLRLGNYWKEFRIVLTFSLSLFALSIFQVTATQSRPILLSIFTNKGADVVAEYRIIEVFPLFIIMIGGTFSSIFLPKTAEMVARNIHSEISNFAYRWTRLTSILANCLCFPFIFSAKEILTSYVGSSYSNLSVWLVLWSITVLIQIHTTPGNSLVLAYGKTKPLVITSAISCIISIIINILCCRYYGVGSAVIGYLVYVVIVIVVYYGSYYKKLMNLSRLKMLSAFCLPTGLAFIALFFVRFIPFEHFPTGDFSERIDMFVLFLVKSFSWGIVYVILLSVFNFLLTKRRRTIW